jgi:hypothetical protein
MTLPEDEEEGDMDIAQLLDFAKSLPDAANPAPGHLGQLIAAVEYAQAGKPIRAGQQPLAVRVAQLHAAVTAAKM